MSTSNDFTTNQPQEPQPEEWRDIPGFEGLYQVSTLGYVRRVYISPNQQRFPYLGILGITSDVKGYSRVSLSKDRTSKRYRVHRLVMLAFVGVCPPRFEVNHKNGIKTDNHLSNLEYCTASQNKRHSIDVLGVTFLHGEDHGNAKLTDEIVIEIRKMLAQGITGAKVAIYYNVCRSTISLIRRNKIWRHVK